MDELIRVICPLSRTLPAICTLAVFIAIPDSRGDDQKPASKSPEIVSLWPSGAPTLQGAEEKEITDPLTPQPGQRVKSIKNVHNPLIEVHLPPPDNAVGTAIIVAPGGGHRQLMWGSEGTDIAEWLNGLGVAAFVLEYRLAQTPGSQYAGDKGALLHTRRAAHVNPARPDDWQ